LRDLLTAVGLVLVLEGAAYALFPGGVRRLLEVARATPEDRLRIGGMAAAAIGLVLVWAVRRLG
jgi:uncharacterized protein YjeT (DUF2065 family)